MNSKFHRALKILIKLNLLDIILSELKSVQSKLQLNPRINVEDLVLQVFRKNWTTKLSSNSEVRCSWKECGFYFVFKFAIVEHVWIVMEMIELSGRGWWSGKRKGSQSNEIFEKERGDGIQGLGGRLWGCPGGLKDKLL